MFHLLRRELRTLKGEVAIDAGCSRLVTTNFFRTKRYYGLEMQLDRLEVGLTRPDLRDNVIGIVAGLPHLDRIVSNCADVVVCTDALFWLSYEDQLEALRELTRICKSDGTLIVTLKTPKKNKSRDKRLPLLQEMFQQAHIRYFRGAVSSYLTDLAERRPKLQSMLFRLWPLEYFSYRREGAHMFVVAKYKNEDVPDQPFDLDRLERLSDNLYSASDRALPQGVVRQELTAGA